MKGKRIDPPHGTIERASVDDAKLLLEQAMQDIVAGRVEWFAIAWSNDKTTIRARTGAAPKTVRFP